MTNFQDLWHSYMQEYGMSDMVFTGGNWGNSSEATLYSSDVQEAVLAIFIEIEKEREEA